MQALFFEPSVQFEKSASETVLGEDPNAWTSEIIQELYKQCPYAADFELMVVMDWTGTANAGSALATSRFQ